MPSLPERRRLGCVIESSGTTVRAQMRSVATLIDVSGTLRVGKTGELLQNFVSPIEIDCSLGNVDLFVVVRHDLLDLVELQESTDVVGSVGDALRSVVERIRERRNPAFLPQYARELLSGACRIKRPP